MPLPLDIHGLILAECDPTTLVAAELVCRDFYYCVRTIYHLASEALGKRPISDFPLAGITAGTLLRSLKHHIEGWHNLALFTGRWEPSRDLDIIDVLGNWMYACKIAGDYLFFVQPDDSVQTGASLPLSRLHLPTGELQRHWILPQGSGGGDASIGLAVDEDQNLLTYLEFSRGIMGQDTATLFCFEFSSGQPHPLASPPRSYSFAGLPHSISISGDWLCFSQKDGTVAVINWKSAAVVLLGLPNYGPHVEPWRLLTTCAFISADSIIAVTYTMFHVYHGSQMNGLPAHSFRLPSVFDEHHYHSAVLSNIADASAFSDRAASERLIDTPIISIVIRLHEGDDPPDTTESYEQHLHYWVLLVDRSELLAFCQTAPPGVHDHWWLYIRTSLRYVRSGDHTTFVTIGRRLFAFDDTDRTDIYRFDFDLSTEPPEWEKTDRTVEYAWDPMDYPFNVAVDYDRVPVRSTRYSLQNVLADGTFVFGHRYIVHHVNHKDEELEDREVPPEGVNEVYIHRIY